MRVFSLVLIALAAAGAEPDSAAKMRASITKQLEAVKRQPRRAENGGSFFTTSWLEPIAATPQAAGPVDADCDPVPEPELQKLIAATATAEGMNPQLLRAVIAQESGGRPCAVSPRGAQGLMQIMPATQAELGLRDPFDAAASLSAGARYLKQLLARYRGDLRLALAAYNAGAARVDEQNDVPRIPETQNYVESILGRVRGADPVQ